MISRAKRKTPLYTIEEICRMNSINYNTSQPSDCIIIKDSDGNLHKIDSTFNLFDNIAEINNYNK